jgi:hypothetical protein
LVATLASCAVGVRVAKRAASGAGKGHRDVRFIVSRKRSTPVPAELPEIDLVTTAEADALSIAGQAVVWAGKTGTVVLEGAGSTTSGRLHACPARQLKGRGASRALGGRGTC